MASLAAAEAAVESIVPACMFAPDRGCADDAAGAEGSEDGEDTSGESADHLDLSSKVGLNNNNNNNNNNAHRDVEGFIQRHESCTCIYL